MGSDKEANSKIVEHNSKPRHRNTSIFQSLRDLKGLEEKFKEYDDDNNGFITESELKKCLKEHGKELSDEQVHSMLEEIDKDHDGKIAYDEFLQYQIKTHTFDD